MPPPWHAAPACGGPGPASHPARSGGGQRRYSRTEIGRIEQVVGLAGEGFTLPAIRRVLELQAEVADLQRQLAVEQARKHPAGPRQVNRLAISHLAAKSRRTATGRARP
ncbi:MAG TPA: MerR family transcriptional regulator [Streptosporangiaceae bacterium]